MRRFRPGLILASLIWILALVPILASAQETEQMQLTGSVLDRVTAFPLPSAHIFYEGTTIGGITDENGQFVLPNPPFDEVFLVISMLGYEVEKIRIERIRFDYQGLEILLTPSVFMLDEVMIEGVSPRGWRRNLKRFNELLFSTTDFGSSCSIENGEVLNFTYDASANSLTVVSQAPLQISNGDLGYKLLIYDLSFNGNQRLYRFTGEMQFSESAPASEKQKRTWAKNRNDAYQGSMRHFLTALVNGRLEEEGFAAYHVDRPGQVSTTIPIAEMGVKSLGSGVVGGVLAPAGSDNTRWLSFSGVLLIQYKKDMEDPDYGLYLSEYAPSSRTTVTTGRKQMSWIELPQGFALIDDSGHLFSGIEGFPIAHYGYWAWERFGEMLPADYNPDSD